MMKKNEKEVSYKNISINNLCGDITVYIISGNLKTFLDGDNAMTLLKYLPCLAKLL